MSGAPTADGWVSQDGNPQITQNGNSWEITIDTGNWNTTNVAQIMLMRIRFKEGTTSRISSITMVPA